MGCFYIACACCGRVSPDEEWLCGCAVLSGECHFECPHCGVQVRRVAKGVQRIEYGGCGVFVPREIALEVVKPGGFDALDQVIALNGL